MTVLDKVAGEIVREQAAIIGSLAWNEAKKVHGLHIREDTGEVQLDEYEPKETINRLVRQYERLFGEASREVCKEAVADILINLSPTDIPSSLQS